MEIRLQIGTHEVRAYPVGESLHFWFQWHEPVFVHDWTCQKLLNAAEEAEYESDYVKAEQNFIRLLVGPGEAKQLAP